MMRLAISHVDTPITMAKNCLVYTKLENRLDFARRTFEVL